MPRRVDKILGNISKHVSMVCKMISYGWCVVNRPNLNVPHTNPTIKHIQLNVRVQRLITVCLLSQLMFQPSDLCPLLFQTPTSRPGGSLCVFVHMFVRVCVGGCVTEWDTNELTDYSGKPRVIISSPRIKHQIKPTAGRRDAGHN